MILGTARYMSPEQARGQTVDKRTDIWAFGCVLYEMLSGRLAFQGATTADTLAAIVHREPDWTALPTDMPSSVGRVLKRCLEKNPKQRLRDLGDLDFELQPPVGAVAPLGRRVSWIPWTIAGAAIVGAGFLALDRLTATPSTESAPVRVEIPPAVNLFDSSTASISPDGRHFVLSGIGPDGTQRFWIRSLDTLETKAIVGTEADVAINTPPPSGLQTVGSSRITRRAACGRSNERAVYRRRCARCLAWPWVAHGIGTESSSSATPWEDWRGARQAAAGRIP